MQDILGKQVTARTKDGPRRGRVSEVLTRDQVSHRFGFYPRRPGRYVVVSPADGGREFAVRRARVKVL